MEKKSTHIEFKKACEIVGGQKKMAELLGVSAPTVNQWVYLIRPIPAEQCPKIEKIVHGRIRCESLLPNVDWSYLRLPSDEKNNESEAA